MFLKSVERGKCFIEYIPAENAWIPIVADGYMVINCLWVSGSFTPITTYALFHNGEYLSNEILNDNKFLKLVQGYTTANNN